MSAFRDAICRWMMRRNWHQIEHDGRITGRAYCLVDELAPTFRSPRGWVSTFRREVEK